MSALALPGAKSDELTWLGLLCRVSLFVHAGLYYRGFVHCFSQIAKTEGLWAFYKGAGAAYFRMAPQAVFGLSIWDNMRRLLLDKVHSAPP